MLLEEFHPIWLLWHCHWYCMCYCGTVTGTVRAIVALPLVLYVLLWHRHCCCQCYCGTATGTVCVTVALPLALYVLLLHCHWHVSIIHSNSKPQKCTSTAKYHINQNVLAHYTVNWIVCLLKINITSMKYIGGISLKKSRTKFKFFIL